ncbi:hypothetical protein EYF80_020255 [Liparis tanakae]|uniref:Uncharacterized protein n=1 Tax=Liparis tanakae TaxID=230148 RepID=A0A4Z2HVG8_9TELE|nr:hypothetical protein EYF80_020255 [Liparis tanakae]
MSHGEQRGRDYRRSLRAGRGSGVVVSNTGDLGQPQTAGSAPPLLPSPLRLGCSPPPEDRLLLLYREAVGSPRRTG